MVLSGNCFLCWLVLLCQMTPEKSRAGIGSLASRHPRPPSHASLSLLQEELVQQLDVLQTQTKQTLLSALPEVTVSSQQVGMGFLKPL